MAKKTNTVENTPREGDEAIETSGSASSLQTPIVQPSEIDAARTTGGESSPPVKRGRSFSLKLKDELEGKTTTFEGVEFKDGRARIESPIKAHYLLSFPKFVDVIDDETAKPYTGQRASAGS